MLNRDSMVAVLIGLLAWSSTGQVDAADGASLVGSIRPTRSSPTDLEVSGPFPSGRTNGFIPRERLMELPLTVVTNSMDLARKAPAVYRGIPLPQLRSLVGLDASSADTLFAVCSDGYSKELSPLGVFAELSTGEGGRRKAEISIPKLYLYRHDWKLDDAESRIGILARVNFARRDSTGMGSYPAEARWMNAGAPLCREDASALPQVELLKGASEAWSVHLY